MKKLNLLLLLQLFVHLLMSSNNEYFVRVNIRGLHAILKHESRKGNNSEDLQLSEEDYHFVNMWEQDMLNEPYAYCYVEGNPEEVPSASDEEKRRLLETNTRAFVLYVHVTNGDPLEKHLNPIFIHYIYTFSRFRRQTYAIKLLEFLTNKFGFNLSAAVFDKKSGALFKKAHFYPMAIEHEVGGKTFLWRFDNHSSRSQRRRWFLMWQKWVKKNEEQVST